MPTEEQLKKRCESLSEGITYLEKKLVVAEQVIAVLEAEKKQWQAEKVMQQQIIQQAINQVNATSNGYLEENRRLKEELKRYRD